MELLRLQRTCGRVCLRLYFGTVTLMFVILADANAARRYQYSEETRRQNSDVHRDLHVCWPGTSDPCCPGWGQYYRGGPCLKRLTHAQSRASTCDSLGCEQQCHVIRGVARCNCHLGYELQFDSRTCKEIYRYEDHLEQRASQPNRQNRYNHRHQTRYAVSSHQGRQPAGTSGTYHRTQLLTRQTHRRPLRLSTFLIYSNAADGKTLYPGTQRSQGSYQFSTYEGGREEARQRVDTSAPYRSHVERDRTNDRSIVSTRNRHYESLLERPMRIKAEIIPVAADAPKQPRRQQILPTHDADYKNHRNIGQDQKHRQNLNSYFDHYQPKQKEQRRYTNAYHRPDQQQQYQQQRQKQYTKFKQPGTHVKNYVSQSRHNADKQKQTQQRQYETHRQNQNTQYRQYSLRQLQHTWYKPNAIHQQRAPQRPVYTDISKSWQVDTAKPQRRKNAFFTSSYYVNHEARPSQLQTSDSDRNNQEVQKTKRKLSFQLIHSKPESTLPQSFTKGFDKSESNQLPTQWNYKYPGNVPNGPGRPTSPCTGVDCYHGYNYNVRLSPNHQETPSVPVHMYPSFNMADYMDWLRTRGVDINQPQGGWNPRNDDVRLSPLMTGMAGRPVFRCGGRCIGNGVRPFDSAINCGIGCNLASYQHHVIQPCGYIGCRGYPVHQPQHIANTYPCGPTGEGCSQGVPNPCSGVPGCDTSPRNGASNPCTKEGVTCDGEPIKHDEVHHNNPCPPEHVYVYLESVSSYQCMLVSEAHKMNPKETACPDGSVLTQEGECKALSAKQQCEHACKNGGTCINKSCKCAKNFTGKACELDVDECKAGNHGCQHGCNNTYGSFQCMCPDGMVLLKDGKNCKDKETMATSPCGRQCANGATCVRNTCVCQPGFTGQFCESDFNECEAYPKLCEHECVNNYGSYKCACPPGKELNRDLRTCSNNTCVPECKNGGSCQDNRCRCKSGYYGSQCELDVDECYHFKPCSHECHNTVGSFYCSCPEGMTLLYHQRECAPKGAEVNN